MTVSISRRRKSVRQIVLPPPPPDPKLTLAQRLDRLADAELGHGHVQAAEHLAHRAAQLRETRA